jgi:predicted nuclease with TOPRIM domain
MSSRPSSKKKSAKKFASARSIVRDDDETMLSMLSAYTNSISRFDGSPRSKSPSGRGEDPADRMIMLKNQLTEALEENAFIKSRLNAELKERHLMEAKYKELNKKFSESKKALQATGAALLQVHNQTSEMKNKRDEREIQLDEALSLNRNLNSKIAELESRLEQALMANGNGTTTANLKKLIDDKENLIKAMEEQQVQLQSQMSKIRRDNYRLGEENAELQEAVESKNRKIANLAKKVSALEEELEGASEFRRQSNSRGRGMSPGNGAARVDPKALESRLNNFEGDKRFLEERMAQLEISLRQSESFMHLMQSSSLEGSPVKPVQQGAYQPVAPSATFNQVHAMTVPPVSEKPSAPSPRKSPGTGSRPSIKASAGTTLLTPIPVESAHEASPAAPVAPVSNKPSLPSLGSVASTTSNGVLTDALFSSSSIVEVATVPNAVLDRPTSAAQNPAPAPAVTPAPPVDASPASSVTSSRRSTKIKKSKSSKEKSEKKDKDREKDKAAPVATAGPSATAEPAVPAPATVPEATQVPVAAPVSGPSAEAQTAAPTVAQHSPSPAPAQAVAAPAPATSAATAGAVTATPPGSVTPVRSGSRENRASIRTPISRDGKRSADGRRPTSSKKPGEAGATAEAPAPVVLEFPPSGVLSYHVESLFCLFDTFTCF